MMMLRTDNPIRDAASYYERQERQTASLPKCELCGEAIQDDYAYELDCGLVCPDCLDMHYKVAI